MPDRSTKRQRQLSGKDQPAFLDASASVSATLFGARRLPEVKSLWKAQPQPDKRPSLQEFESGGGKTSSRHLRRRTTSHKSRKRHRFPRGTELTESKSKGAENEKEKTPCRRARRKPALMRQQHELWRSTTTQSAASFSTLDMNWSTTHLWHVKRFHVHPSLFGWKVPLLHTNRGTRSALRLAAEGHTLLQDVTWRMQPLVVGSSDLKTLVGSFRRICPEFLSAENPNAILSGSCFGQGLLHEPDKFPMGAIGPAMWWVCRNRLDSSFPPEENEMWWVHIFMHPNMRTSICDVLTSVRMDAPMLEAPSELQGGLSWFQLRGKNVWNALEQALAPTTCIVSAKENATTCEFVWDKVRTIYALHTRILDFTAVSVQVSLDGRRKAQDDFDQLPNEDCQAYIDSFANSVRRWNPNKNPGRAIRLGGHSVILVARCQIDPSLPQNAATCGWDLLCHPSDANEIFHALSEKGEACAIGLIEETHIQLESEPPLPTFPRDYPDTPAGQRYWSSGDDKEWLLLRQCLEEGWGRIDFARLGRRDSNKRGLSKPQLSWDRITTLPKDAEYEHKADEPVVVRGGFGQPFLDLIAGSGHVSSSDGIREVGTAVERKRRRPRRRVRPPSKPVLMGRLTSEEASAHQSMCHAFRESLSLPALIFCHVKVDGKGTIGTGMHIHASIDGTEAPGFVDFLIGEIVAGSFSMSRGGVHGVGFVGAARLLHVLGSNRGRSICATVSRRDGSSDVELKAILKTSCAEIGGRNATVSLLM